MSGGQGPERRLAGELVEIARFRAKYGPVELQVDDDCQAASPRLGLFQPEAPESHIDPQELLRSKSVEEPPYWLLLWIGARAIAHEMLTEPPPAGARVLDLGCGLGLSGLAAGQGGAHVTFCDKIEACLGFAAASAEANGLRNFETVKADFVQDSLGRRFDLILAADIVYDPASYGALADFLDQHLDESGSVLLTESLRADAGVFLQAMKDRGFGDERRAMWVMEEGRRERTWLHRLCRIA